MSVQRRKPRICPGGESAGGFTQGLEGLPKALKKEQQTEKEEGYSQKRGQNE